MDEKKRKRIQKLITKLSSSSENETFNALLEIRKNFLKAKEGISFLSKYGGGRSYQTIKICENCSGVVGFPDRMNSVLR
jgi:DNA replication protein DnaC